MRSPFRRRSAEPKETEPGQKDLARPSAEDIYRQVASNARQELRRTNTALAISGFGGGGFMGLSALGPAIGAALLGHGPVAHLVALMFYPLGFIVVIVGRLQLFTENTLYPVALVLQEKREFWRTMRLWSIVLPANIAGALAFAMLAAWTPAIEPAVVQALTLHGMEGLAHPAAAIFWSGVIGGGIIAMAAWLVSGSHSITGSVMLIWMLTYIIGLGGFAHCIATSCDIIVAALAHHVSWAAYGKWLAPAVAGNVCGGVGLVTVLEYGQAVYGKADDDGKTQRDESEEAKAS